MKARFVGDPNDGNSGPDTLTVWGVEFEKGKWTDVGDDERFARHSHFEVRGDAPRGRTVAADASE